MVGEGLLDAEDDPLALGVRRVGIEGLLERRDDGVAVLVGVVDEEPGVVREVGVEGQPQQAALAAGADPVRDVEEGLWREHAVLHHPDPAGLLDDEEAVRRAAFGRHVHG